MEILTYVGRLALDNLAWIVVVAILVLFIAPFHVWVLLRNNRPARGTGWKMWLADRYIQIWLSSKPLDSSEGAFEFATPLGFAGTVIQRATPRKNIDLILEDYGLVRRSDSTVRARRDVHVYLRNWMTYFICKWFLILFWGDTRKWYEEIASPPTRINLFFMKISKEAFRRIAALCALLVLLFVFAKILPLLKPVFDWYGKFVAEHLATK
ncbi:MAG: hypothetical protein WCS85_04160 [Candidatus Peribacteraceae bacterium]